jgi:hypothetical protein
MPRGSLKSTVTLLALALLSVGATEPEGCTGSPHSSKHHALPSGSLMSLGGLFFITGHAPDFHAPQDAGAARLLTKSLAYVRDGNTLPFLWVESRINPPAGRRSGKDGLRSVGLMEGRDYLHMDAAQLAAQPASWWDALSSNFSALVVASDRALLTQAEVDQLNAHRGDLSRFMKDLRGILAFAESGAGGSQVGRDPYEFLPFTVYSDPSATPPFSVTAFGQQALGLDEVDVSSPAYNHFAGSFGFQIITISDSNGDIIAVAGRVELYDEYIFANAGADETFYGPGRRIPVTLNGSGSITDPAAQPMHYMWVINDSVVADTDQPIITVQLPPGVYEITLILSNARGEVMNDEVTMTVIQSAAPGITCPANLTVPTAPVGVCGAPVSFPAPTVSAPNGVKSLTCTPGSGSAFPLGNTQVTCTVVDQSNQSASCSFLVMVKDQEPPALVPPAPTVSEADAACQASLPDVASQAQASDNCTPRPELVIRQSPSVGTLLSAGTHTIQLQVTDKAGNTTTTTATHTVVDVTPPTITRATPSKQTLWPPNHKMVPVTVGVVLSDNCGGSTIPAQCRILRVTSNEPINGPGDGNTDWDWELLNPLTVNLRAERAGLLNSRIYTLWVECQDSGGQIATTTTTVTVPHDQRGR